MRYPWVGLSIFGVWIAIAVILAVNKNIDASFLYIIGVAVSVVFAMVGFRSA